VARRFADRLPAEAAEEIVLTGSASSGVADELSDLELLLVPHQLAPLADCARMLEAAGLEDVTTWTPPGADSWWCGGSFQRVRIEAIWWPTAKVEARLDGILTAEIVDHARARTAEALANGLALRTAGGLAAWQERLAVYPLALAEAVIEDAAEAWGGDPPETMLTILRPGDRLALTEWLLADAERVLRIVHALNRAWEPGWKRLPQRVAALPLKPERLAERVEEVLLEPDGRRALRLSAELAADTVALAPATPCVVRARHWLPALVEVLR